MISAADTTRLQLSARRAAAAVATLVAEIAAAKEAGMSDRAIAAAIGVSHPTVAKILRQAGGR